VAGQYNCSNRFFSIVCPRQLLLLKLKRVRKTVAMPGNKRWYFELNRRTILVCRDGREVTSKNVPLGPVKELYYGAEKPQAKTFKLHAVEVSRVWPVYRYALTQCAV